jgi:hypothetical protein
MKTPVTWNASFSSDLTSRECKQIACLLRLRADLFERRGMELALRRAVLCRIQAQGHRRQAVLN